MKIKSLTMLAGMGLITASMAYSIPVLAEYNNSNNDQNMQAPSDTQMPNPSMPATNNNNSSDDNNGNTPDTATGDDDY